MTAVTAEPVVTIVCNATDPSDGPASNERSPIHHYTLVSSTRYLILEIIPGALLQNQDVAQRVAGIDLTVEVQKIALELSRRLGLDSNDRMRDCQISIKRDRQGRYTVWFEEQLFMGRIEEFDFNHYSLDSPTLTRNSASAKLTGHGRHISILVSAGAPEEDCWRDVYSWAVDQYVAHGYTGRDRADIHVTHREHTSQYRVQIAQHATEFSS